MHYLRWEMPTTLYGWEEAGMSYESTLGYADIPGFRCGTCFEYPGFDPVNRTRLKVRVRPLIVMECSVISDEYLGLGNSEKAINIISHLKARVKRLGGAFTLLWHNSRLTTKKFRDLYKEVIF